VAPTKQRSAPDTPPPVAGAQPWQRPDWIPSGTGIDFLDELHVAHAAACDEYGWAVDHAASVLDELEDEAAKHHLAVRAALAAGEPVPPLSADPAVGEAKLSLARESVVDCETVLAEFVVSALAELRARRRELQPVMATLPDALRSALSSGPGGRVNARLDALTREITALNGTEIVTDEPTEEAAHAA
jgi:hypothetical protein